MPESLGQFEQIILTAILSLRDKAYGVTIHERAVQLAAPKSISLGAVYVTLDRLEDKGLISSWLSDPTPQRGGRPHTCFRGGGGGGGAGAGSARAEGGGVGGRERGGGGVAGGGGGGG